MRVDICIFVFFAFFKNKAKVTQSFRVAVLFVLTIGTIEIRIKPSLFNLCMVK